MSISELGSIGEFIGSIAVVITLVFLTIQIRQSNRMAITNEVSLRQSLRVQAQSELSSSDFLVPAMEKAQAGPFVDKQWSDRRERACDNLGITAQEFMRLYWFHNQLFQYWEYITLHPFKDETGAISVGFDWRFKVNMSGLLSQAVVREIWVLSRPVYDAQFQQAVDNVINDMTLASANHRAELDESS